MNHADPYTLAIIGLGPKGLACLERLIAHLGCQRLLQPVEIYVFQCDGRFGYSPVYALDQPDYVILNVAVGGVDLWSATDPPPFAGRGPNFIDWYAARFPTASRLTGDEFLSRAIVGEYLHAFYQRLVAHLPDNVRLIACAGEVVDLAQEQAGLQIFWRDRGGDTSMQSVHQALLATGHSRLKLGAVEREWQAFSAKKARATFIPFVYPVQHVLNSVTDQQTVAIKGLGLTFIDAVLALTEGRGGRFVRAETGCLHYRRSHKEPRMIYPFSRTGLPMAPKPVDLPTTLRPLTFFTPAALQKLRRMHGGQLSLDQGPWHLFQREMELWYYRWAMQDAFADQLASLGADDAALQSLIRAFHRQHPEVPPFDPTPILDPLAGTQVADEEYNAFVETYMRTELNRAQRGIAGDGLKSALDIWFEVRYVLGDLMAFGGLTPASHRRLIEEIMPQYKRVVFGPPLINIEKLHALLRAGLLDFSVARAPRVTPDDARGLFRLETARGQTAFADVLVDGRYPDIQLEQDASPLYQSLLQRGMIRRFENRGSGDALSVYRPGAIDHTPVEQHVVDAMGQANPNLSVIGIPTEGNLVGNFTIVPNHFPNTWARGAVARMQESMAADAL